MGIEFVEGKCCGDCAKCELELRPRTGQGIMACAVANILPMVYCCHDLLIEQNTLLAKVLKKKDEEIEELKELVKKSLNHCKCDGKDKDKEDKEDKESGKNKKAEEPTIIEDQSAEESASEGKVKARKLTK